MVVNSCWPTAVAYALLSYGPAVESVISVGPGCSTPSDTRSVGAPGPPPSRCRFSRSHAPAASASDAPRSSTANVARRSFMESSWRSRVGQRGARDAVGVENAVDCRLAPNDHRLDACLERRIAAAHAHRDVEHERQIRQIDLWMNGRHGQRHRGTLGEIAGEWSPHDGNVDAVLRDGVDDPCRRIGLAVVAVDRKADD